MVTNILTLIKILTIPAMLAVTAYFSYDYGVTRTQYANQTRQNALLDKLEQKQNEAYELAVTLARQKPVIDIQYRTIEKEVIRYAQTHSDKQCVANDNDWLRIRADAVRAHNRAIGIQPAAPVPDDPTQTTGSKEPYQTDTEVLAEDVSNLKICAENPNSRPLQL